ncbi:MAG: hypothetical protein HQL67_11060 [Magnetococcales bacterium]|nr:hypothetical protein [Magnetococcales bacterium]
MSHQFFEQGIAPILRKKYKIYQCQQILQLLNDFGEVQEEPLVSYDGNRQDKGDRRSDEALGAWEGGRQVDQSWCETRTTFQVRDDAGADDLMDHAGDLAAPGAAHEGVVVWTSAIWPDMMTSR